MVPDLGALPPGLESWPGLAPPSPPSLPLSTRSALGWVGEGERGGGQEGTPASTNRRLGERDPLCQLAGRKSALSSQECSPSPGAPQGCCFLTHLLTPGLVLPGSPSQEDGVPSQQTLPAPAPPAPAHAVSTQTGDSICWPHPQSEGARRPSPHILFWLHVNPTSQTRPSPASLATQISLAHHLHSLSPPWSFFLFPPLQSCFYRNEISGGGGNQTAPCDSDSDTKESLSPSRPPSPLCVRVCLPRAGLLHNKSLCGAPKDKGGGQGGRGEEKVSRGP